jgi:phage tail sheath protein FI
MGFQVSPGVNVSEIDLTTVVPAVSTTEGAIAAHLKWGPVEELVLVDSEDRLVNIFNKPNANTASDFFTASNFLTYASALWVSRAVDSTATNASSGAGGGLLIKNKTKYDEEFSTSSTKSDWYAKYAGDLGNSLKVSTCSNANAWIESFSTNFSNTAGRMSATGNVSILFTAGSKNIAISYGGNTAHVGSSVTGKFSKGDILLSSNNIVLGQVDSIVSNTSILMTGTYSAFSDGGTSDLRIGATTSTAAQTAAVIKRRWEYYNEFDTIPSTTAYANTVNSQGDAIHVVVVDEDGTISGTKGAVLERYNNLSIASDAKTEQGATNYYKDVINQQSSWIYWGKHQSNLTNAGTRADRNNTGSAGSGTNFVTKSTPTANSMVSGIDGPAAGNDDYIRASNKFKSAEEVDVSFILGSNHGTAAIQHYVNNIAEDRKDCIVMISPTRASCVNNTAYEGKETVDVIASRDTYNIDSSYAVMDSGWKYMYDKYNDLYRYVPLNGDMAGLCVQTDVSRDPWWSPGGFNRGHVKNVIKLAYNPAKADRDQLYKDNINPVVTFPGQGTILFGDKTLQSKPSAFDRINVRRLFIVLEKAISTAAKYTLFEFNDEFTRSQFKNLVEPFLRDVQGRRGITDFRVVCDGTNNTGEVIDRNEFVGDIYIKPARSINFIQLNFVAVRTGVEFSEVVGKF